MLLTTDVFCYVIQSYVSENFELQTLHALSPSFSLNNERELFTVFLENGCSRFFCVGGSPKDCVLLGILI